MSDWKDDKGLGPWDFTPSPYKNHYNEGGYISSVDDPVWDITAQYTNKITDPHNPHCGYWPKIIGEGETQYVSFPQGEWKAALEQSGTPYVYLMDIDYDAVIKIDTSLDPPEVADRLRINHDDQYGLDYDVTTVNGSVPGNQRGGYCISQDGNTLWYLFTDKTRHTTTNHGVANAVLFEVDITPTEIMSLIDSTTFTDLTLDHGYAESLEVISDAVTDDTYTYWPTSYFSGRILKIRNSDHVLITDHRLTLQPVHNNFDEGVGGIDYTSGSLYFSTVEDIYDESGGTLNTRYKVYKTDTSFAVDTTRTLQGVGLSSKHAQSMLRVYGGYLYTHRSYYPTVGYLKSFNLSSLAIIDGQGDLWYGLNFLGTAGNTFYMLHHYYSVTTPSFLTEINVSSGNLEKGSSVGVSHYTGHGQLSIDEDMWWDRSGTSVFNTISNRSMLFTWRSESLATAAIGPHWNYGTTYSEGLDFKYDVAMDRFLYDPIRGLYEDETLIP